MATRSTDLNDVYVYNGSLAAAGSTLVASSFTGPSTSTLEFEDADNDLTFETGESATLGSDAILSSINGTATVGVSIGGLLDVDLGTPVPVNVFESATTSYVQYPDTDQAALLDALVTEVLAQPGIGATLSILGITDVAAYVEQNALLTFDLAADVAIPVCFAEGTLILTKLGPVAVEDLKPGDRVFTRDNGFQAIRWIGSRRVTAVARFAPVVFPPGSIGNDRTLLVSPEHRILVTGWAAELVSGTPEVLVAAKHLVDGATVTQRQGGDIEYFHLMFDRHEIVVAEGAYCESFHPGSMALRALDKAAREEILALFPELEDAEAEGRHTARSVLKRREAAVVGEAIRKVRARTESHRAQHPNRLKGSASRAPARSGSVHAPNV